MTRRRVQSTALTVLSFLFVLIVPVCSEGGIAALQQMTGNRPYRGFGNAPAEGLFGGPDVGNSQWSPGFAASVDRPGMFGGQWNRPAGPPGGFGGYGRWYRPQMGGPTSGGWDDDMEGGDWSDGRLGHGPSGPSQGSSSFGGSPAPLPPPPNGSGGGRGFYTGRGNPFVVSQKSNRQ